MKTGGRLLTPFQLIDAIPEQRTTLETYKECCF